jgi:replicative DNA helicase
MSGEVIPMSREPMALSNPGTEVALIAAMLALNECIDPVADLVAPEDFSDDFFGNVFRLATGLHSQGQSVNVLTLRPALGDEAVRTLIDLTKGPGASAAVIGARDFARQIADFAKRRRLVESLQKVIGDVSAWDMPVADLAANVDEAMSNALRVRTTERSQTLAQAFDTTLQAIEDEAAGLGPQGIKISGLDDFNSLTGDLRRGELMYLGGRPSMGKTALSLRLALGAAANGNGTLFVSLEMRVPELTTRAMADLAFEYGQSPGFGAIRRGKIDVFTRERLAEARAMIDSYPLILTDPPSLNIGRLAMMVRRYKRRMEAAGNRLDLVIIDYLGLIKGSDRRAKRYEEVGEISRTLKEVAKECDVAIVCLAQLNRECERRDDKRPMLSDLRDAGDIEQDADTVMFVYRDEYYLERAEPDVTDKKRAEWEISMGHARDRMEIIAAKVRNGRAGTRNLSFFAEHQAVRNSTYMRDSKL